MTVLVTGGAGQLGRALRAELPDAEFGELPEVDITDRAALAARDWSRTTAIVNTAAWTAVDAAEHDILAAWDVNATGVAELAAAVRAGHGVEVTVGSTAADGDGGYFLNTFALGVYPDLVRHRERSQGAIGKWPAMAVAMALTLRAAEPVHVEVDGQARTLWTLFAGNGHYHPAGFAPTWRERLDDGCIDVRLVDAGHPLARVRLVLALLTGRLGRSRVHEQRIVAKLPVRSRQGGLRIARDGEVSDGPGHLLLRAASRTLVVYRPATG